MCIALLAIMTSERCPICCDNYTTITRQAVECLSCSHKACVRCVKSYLLGSMTDPQCMNCKKFWNSEFIDTHMTKSWRNGEYRKHRAAILLDREKSLLPATQPAVEAELEKRAAKIEMEKLQKEFINAKNQIDKIQENMHNQYIILTSGPWGLAEEKEIKDKRQFVAACPKESCRGFLSSGYKCGTCQDHVCAACREVLGPNRDIAHTCDPGLVETIKAIQKDSRACPKCGVNISRVEGCDQMFCTQCDTAFSYAKGTVIQGAIHNPHYFARLQQLGGIIGGAGAGAGGGGCRLPSYHLCVMPYKNLHMTKKNLHFLDIMFRSSMHAQDVYLVEQEDEENVDVRVKYLLNELDEKKLSTLLLTRERKRERKLEIRGPLELFVITMLEFFMALAETKRDDVVERIEACRATIYSINQALKKIGDRYSCIVPQIKETELYNAFVAKGYTPKSKQPEPEPGPGETVKIRIN